MWHLAGIHVHELVSLNGSGPPLEGLSQVGLQ